MTHLSDIWAKSPPPGSSTDTRGESLTDHSLAALRQAKCVHARTGHLPYVPEWFWTAVALAALLHDTGKFDTGCQASLRPGGATWGERHEVLSLAAVGLLLPEETFFRRWVAVLVATHHRPLTRENDPGGRSILPNYLDEFAPPLHDRFTGIDDESARQLLAWMRDQAREHRLLEAPVEVPAVTAKDLLACVDELLHEIDTRPQPGSANPLAESSGLAWVLGRAAITFADHLASAHVELVADHPLGDFPTRFRTSTSLFAHQRRADRPTCKHLLLRAATGSGKTEAALLRAEHAIDAISAEHGGLPRVFYVLPYLASINAMADRLRAKLGTDVGVLHSRAGIYHLGKLDDDQDETGAAQALSAIEATRLHRERLRVTTPYQLLQGAFAGVTEASMLLDTTGSVFLFDELHAYEPRRLGMFLAMMRLWARELHGRIVVLSATLPSRFTELFGDTVGHDQVDLVDQLTPETRTNPHTTETTPVPPPRHRLYLARTHLTDPESIDRIAADLRGGLAVLVIANNITDAIHLYTALRDHAPETGEGRTAAWLLHARFRHGDRFDTETAVTTWFATSSEGQPPRAGLLVATQAAEVSLNVDLDALHTSGAPPEPLIQRMGRVNRLGLRAPAPVWINTPRLDEPVSNPRADRVYERTPTEHAWNSMLPFDGQLITEADAQRWVDELYTGAWGDAWEAAVRRHQEDFTRDFLDFSAPFEDRSQLKTKFFEQFDGFEAILADDRDTYRELLTSEPRSAGRLRASRLHIPLPHHQMRRATFDTELRIHYVDGDYTPELGLTTLYDDPTYQPGEII